MIHTLRTLFATLGFLVILNFCLTWKYFLCQYFPCQYYTKEKIAKNYIHFNRQVSMWVMASILKFSGKFQHCIHKSHEFLLISQNPGFEDQIKLSLNFHPHWYRSIFESFPPLSQCAVLYRIDFFYRNGFRGFGLKEHISSQNKLFFIYWNVAVLIAFVFPIFLLHWHTFGWMDFASNILQCIMKTYSGNNNHCVNIIWTEQVLALVVIHPVFLHLNIWFCLNTGLTVQQKCHFDQQNIFKDQRNTQHFVSSFSVSIIALIK